MSLSPIPPNGISFPSTAPIKQEKACLDGYYSQSELSLEKKEIFTQETLQFLIINSQVEEKHYFFVLVETIASKRFLYDGANFCQWLKHSESLQNPVSREEIITGHFYLVPKNLSIEQIREGSPIPFLCTLEEYLDFNNRPFFHHFIESIEGEEDKNDLLMFNLILDILLHRGIPSDKETALFLIQNQANHENPYCMIFMSLLLKKTAFLNTPNFSTEIYDQKAADQLTAAHAQQISIHLEQLLDSNVDSSASDEEPEERFQKLYAFLKAHF